MLMRTGGLALDLVRRNVTTVEDSEGEHPWWRAPHMLPTHSADEWEITEAAVTQAEPGNSAPASTQKLAAHPAETDAR